MTEPHYHVYIEAVLGPFKQGSPFPLGRMLKHAARLIFIQSSDGRQEIYKDQREWPGVFPEARDFYEELQCVRDAFGHLSTGGDRTVHQDLIKDTFALLDHFYKSVTNPMQGWPSAPDQEDEEPSEDEDEATRTRPCLTIPADFNKPMEFLPSHPCTLRELQKLVGGNIELARFGPQNVIAALDAQFNCKLGENAALWCNEEGKIHELPFNERASAIAADPTGIYGDAFVMDVP